MFKECLVVASLVLVLAIALNAIHPRGLKWTRDYFPLSEEAQEPRASSEGISEEEVAAALREAGLQPLDWDEARALHDDERREYGGVLFLDTRPPRRFDESRIAGSLSFDPMTPDSSFEVIQDACYAAEVIVLYCQGGSCEDSALANLALIDRGLDPSILFVYAGGFEGWRKRGGPLEDPAAERDEEEDREGLDG